MKSVAPFKISVPDETLNYIRSRVKAYRWHEMPDDGGWDYGTNLDYLREFCTYWVEEFDWRKLAVCCFQPSFCHGRPKAMLTAYII